MPDLLQISLGTTHGLRVSDAWFAALTERAGVTIETVAVRIGLTSSLRRAYPINDIVEAAAARRATASSLRRMRPLAVVFSTTTAALFAPDLLGRPYAIRLDAPAALNRPGSRNAILHALERRRLADARVVLPTSEVAAHALPAGAAPVVVVPPPLVVPDLSAKLDRDRVAVAYTPDPKAKGLDLLCRAWELAAVPDARLEVFGIERDRALRHLGHTGVAEPDGVRWRGLAPAQEFHAALARCRTFITSARWEDFGMAQLEALALGALLVCTATGGPFEAGELARELKPQLVAADQSPGALSESITWAFALADQEIQAYGVAASARLSGYRPEAVASTIAERVIPALL